MANEVIIEEYGPQLYKTNGVISGAAMGQLITTQIKTIGTLSDALNAKTAYVVVQSKGTGFWAIPGDAATANTAGNVWIPADQSKEFVCDGTFTKIDTAA